MENKYLAHHAKSRRKRVIDLSTTPSNTTSVGANQTNRSRNKRPRIRDSGRAGGCTGERAERAVKKTDEAKNYAEKSTANGSYKKYQVRRRVGASDPRLPLLDRAWACNTDAQIVDIGCNDGAFTTQLARRYPHAAVTGFDLDAALVARAERSTRGAPTRPGGVIKYEMRDVCATPLPESHYDLVLALSVSKWLHFRAGDDGLRKFFYDVYRSLRPNGVFVLEPQPMKSYKLARKKGAVPAHMTCDKFKFKPEQFVDFLVKKVGFNSVTTLHNAESTPKNTPFGTRPVYAFFKSTLITASIIDSKAEGGESTPSTSTHAGLDSQCVKS